MDNVNQESGYSNTTIAYTTLNPLGIYSDKIKDIAELADGATVRYQMTFQMRAAHYCCCRRPG